MRTTLSIALILLTTTISVPAALADPPEVRQVTSPTPQTAVESIIAQERAREGDPALLGPSRAPVQIVGSSDEFDLLDAGIGGVTALALALLATAALAFRSNRRRTASAAG